MAGIKLDERLHPGGAGWAAVFDDATGEGREPSQMEAFIHDVMEAGERHGFKLKQWGNVNNVQRYWARMTLLRIVDKLVSAEGAGGDGT